MNDKIAGKFRGTGIKAGLMYGMAEFYGGGAFVMLTQIGRASCRERV